MIKERHYKPLNIEGMMTYMKISLVSDLMDVMWPISQSHFHVYFLCLLKSNLFFISFICDICNKVHEHMQ